MNEPAEVRIKPALASHAERVAARFSRIERGFHVIKLMLTANLALEIALLVLACRR